MDSQGRTALFWAAARAQLEDIGILISYGADPNAMDITGRSVVLSAVDKCSGQVQSSEPSPHT